MRKQWNKWYWRMGCGLKMSRKAKKQILGVRPTRRALRERLAQVVITRDERGNVVDMSNQFCPKCGCEAARSTGNMVEWPEVWRRTYCARCGYLVGEADNSPWHHCLEYPEEGYVL